MKKIRFSLSHFMEEVLREDKSYFHLEIGAIGNRLFEYYADKDVEKIDYKGKFGATIQFNLSKSNEDMFFKVLQEQESANESEYMRNVIFSYMNNPRYQRERILFSAHFDLLERAIQTKKKVNVKYKGKVRTLSPYFIKVSDQENRSYLFCYSEESSAYRCYRVSEMESLKISKYDREEKDEEYIRNIETHFDPFQSYGKEVKVRFTEEGLLIWEKALHNRPKVLKEEGREFLLECDSKLAQIYFPQFLEEVEVLEPSSLRDWFREKSIRFAKQYEKKR